MRILLLGHKFECYIGRATLGTEMTINQSMALLVTGKLRSVRFRKQCTLLRADGFSGLGAQPHKRMCLKETVACVRFRPMFQTFLYGLVYMADINILKCKELLKLYDIL